jgi:hypothetical protein
MYNFVLRLPSIKKTFENILKDGDDNSDEPATLSQLMMVRQLEENKIKFICLF